ncbi:MAG TPA: putative Ig domain-containing protein [Bacteroidales bacterium]|nr:putative Ig domain-containing protein [Bacteroidales bacterium]
MIVKKIVLLFLLVLEFGQVQSKTLDVIVFGNISSETGHAFVSNSTQVISGALSQSARQCLPLSSVGINGGDMSFTMTVDPLKRNYVSVKFWGEDESTYASDMGRLYLYVFLNGVNYSTSGRHESDYTALSLDGGKPPLPGRFFYSTTMLPLWMTKGKTSLTLKIVSTGRIYGLGSGVAPSGNYQFLMDAPSRGIYKAFTHDEAMLNVYDEVNGSAPSAGTPLLASESVLSSGGSYYNLINNRINNRLAATVSVKNFTTEDVEYLARSYSVPKLVGFNNAAVVLKVVALIDSYTNDFYDNKNSVVDGGNEGWGGRYGHLGYAICLLKDQLQNWLDVTIPYKTGMKTRREAWSEMLLASRDYGRMNRRTITNQTCWADQSIYCANKGLLALGDARALSEAEAQRYLKEAVGISPWLGSDLPLGGSSKPYGTNYYQVTNKGLSREFGYVGTNYGEMSPFAARFYRLTGNEEFRQQAIKMVKARINFRRPAVQVKNSAYYWAMEGIGLLAWRGGSECDGNFANQIAYGDRSADFGGMYCAASTHDPDLIAYAKQMLDDKQYFESLSGLTGTFFANLDVFEDYTSVMNATGSAAKLPMTNGQPDFVWADEENAIVALKQGDDRLWISSYWQANNGINSLARFHFSTPNYDQYGVLETTPQFRNSGTYKVRSTTVDNMVQTYLPDNPVHAYSGELLPISISESMSNTAILGKADCYTFRFGKYFFGINMSATQSGNIRMPRGYQSATELISRMTVSDTLFTLFPRTSKVFCLNSTEDSLALPVPPVLLYIASQSLPRVTLCWNDASGAISYVLKRSQTHGGPYSPIATGLTSTTYTDNSSASNCYYVVSAVNEFGESTDSPEIPVSAYVNERPIFTSALTASVEEGSFFSYTTACLYNPTSYQATGLPDSLQINTLNGVLSGVLTTSGTYSIDLSATNAAGTTHATLVLTVTAAQVPTITSPASSTAYIGVPYGFKIDASNNPIRFEATGLPGGFTMNGSNGLFTGKFTSTGVFIITLKAINAAGSVQKTLRISVVNPPVPEIISELSKIAISGSPFSYFIIASYAPVSFTASGLPSGLTLDSSTGEISGTTSATGTYSVTLKAVNAGGSSTATTLKITVMNLPPAPWIVTDVFPTGGIITRGYSTYVPFPESFTLNGAGSDIGSNNDSFHFVYKRLTGNGTFVARLASRILSGSGVDKVGLVMRESTASNAKCVFLTIDYRAKEIRFPLRSSTGGGMTYPAANETTTNGNTIPIWFKLERIGNTFNGYMSLDNAVWTLVGSNLVNMTDSIQVGMAVCSRTTSYVTTTYDNVSLNGFVSNVHSPSMNQVCVYPNPFNDELRFVLPETSNEHVWVKVSDLLGRVLFEKTLEPTSQLLDLSMLPKGNYILMLKTNSRTVVEKIRKH